MVVVDERLVRKEPVCAAGELMPPGVALRRLHDRLRDVEVGPPRPVLLPLRHFVPIDGPEGRVTRDNLAEASPILLGQGLLVFGAHRGHIPPKDTGPDGLLEKRWIITDDVVVAVVAADHPAVLVGLVDQVLRREDLHVESVTGIRAVPTFWRERASVADTFASMNATTEPGNAAILQLADR